MSLPYLPLFVDDYEADTAHLSLVEDGIYSRLLRLCWRSPKCQMPNDHEWIARKIRATSKAEREAMANVLAEFFVARRGAIFSKRLSAEFERVSASVQKRKKAGKSGGVAKSLKSKETEAGNATAMPQHVRASYPEPEPYEKATAFSERASAKKQTGKSGWVSRRTVVDATASLIEEIEDHEHRRAEGSNEIAGNAVRLIPAVRTG